MNSKGYLFSIEAIVGALIMLIFVISVFSLSVDQGFQESKAIPVAGDVLNLLNENGKLQTYILNKNYNALGQSVEELLPSNTNFALILDGELVYGVKKEGITTTATYFVPTINRDYELREIRLEVYV